MTRKDKRERSNANPSREQGGDETAARSGLMDGVPTLIYGESSNLREVERCLSNRAIYEFGVHLGSCIEKLVYELPADIVYDKAKLKDDVMYKKIVETRVVKREEVLTRLEENKPRLYHAILSILSSEGEEAARKHKNFKSKAEGTKDPLELWRIVRETHLVPSNNPDVDTVKMQCRAKYACVKMSDFETIASFKPRFDFIRKASIDAGNAEPAALDVAMDFLQALNDKQYGDFRVSILNDKTAGVGNFPKTLEEMYIRAASYLVNSGSASSYSGDFRAAFTSLSNTHSSESKGSRRGGRGAGKRGGHVKRSGRGHSDRKPVATETRKCHLCGEVGHLQRACPLANEDCGSPESEPTYKKKKKTGLVAFKIAGVSITQSVKRRALVGAPSVRLDKNTIILDNAANFSLFYNHNLLGKLRAPAEDDDVYGIDGEALACASIAPLEGFFNVGVNIKSIANILSLDEVERMSTVEYEQSVSYTVHTDMYEPIVFGKDSNRLYSSDIRTWVKKAQRTALVTVSDNKAGYSKREVKAAEDAMELVKSLGHPTQTDAIKMVSSGANLSNCIVTGEDVRRAFQIFGGDASAMKGKKKKQATGSRAVNILPVFKPKQTLYTDPMYIDGKTYLFSVCKPLGLKLATRIPNETTQSCGAALTNQLDVLREREFVVDKALTDRAKALLKLKGKIAGVVINSVGAGDHVVDVENEIKTFKERVRCVKADLAWKLPVVLGDALVEYVVGRCNMMPPHDGRSAECPRVQFLGRKTDAEKELGLSFGDYAEVKDDTGISNDTNNFRTSSCIALHPTGNDNMSWKFFDFMSEEFITRSRWWKLPTTEVVIARINELAAKDSLPRASSAVPSDNPLVINTEVQSSASVSGGALTGDAANGVLSDQNLSAGVSDKDKSDVVTEGDPPTDVSSSNEIEQPSSGRAKRAAGTVARERIARFAAGKRMKAYNFHITVRQGVKTRGKAAVQSMKEELKSLVKKEAMHPMLFKDLSKTQRKKVLQSCMFLKEKFNSMGEFEKLKSRLVANGKQQERSEMEDTSSPTVKLSSVMIMLAVAANVGMKASTHDVGTAYLNAEMTGEDVFIKLDTIMANLLI